MHICSQTRSDMCHTPGLYCLTARASPSILLGEERRQDVLGRKALCTWTTETVRRVPLAQRSQRGKPSERSSPLVRGGLSRTGAVVTHRLAVVQPPAQLLPSTGVGQ